MTRIITFVYLLGMACGAIAFAPTPAWFALMPNLARLILAGIACFVVLVLMCIGITAIARSFITPDDPEENGPWKDSI